MDLLDCSLLRLKISSVNECSLKPMMGRSFFCFLGSCLFVLEIQRIIFQYKNQKSPKIITIQKLQKISTKPQIFPKASKILFRNKKCVSNSWSLLIMSIYYLNYKMLGSQPKAPTYGLLLTKNSHPLGKQTPLRLLSNLQELPSTPSTLPLSPLSPLAPKRNLADLYVYTNNSVFFNVLNNKALNKELASSDKLFEMIHSGLTKGKNSIVEFDQSEGNLKFYIELNQHSIRIKLFELNVIKLDSHPLKHAMRMLISVSRKSDQFLEECRMSRAQEVLETNKILALKKQLSQMYETEASYMKMAFISAVNQVKQKLRPQFGARNDEKSSSDQEETQTIARPIYKIKSMDKNQPSRESIGFMNLFE